jgi:hypothetical protein
MHGARTNLQMNDDYAHDKHTRPTRMNIVLMAHEQCDDTRKHGSEATMGLRARVDGGGRHLGVDRGKHRSHLGDDTQ